ncbi:MAG: hypothetical protein R2911_18460 [Caldilineaceae bacterium]
MDAARAMTQAGRGVWFGAYLGEQLVGSLGLFVEGALGALSRSEHPPGFRRRGICGTLLHHASQHGFQEMGARQLVIMPVAEYNAARIYASVGYRQVEWQSGLTWWEGIEQHAF